MELKQNNRLLKREYFKALFPVMFSVLGATVNALIDSVFVSRRLGGSALAAVNLSMPVYLILCTAGSLISGGASVCSAREAGRDNMKSTREYRRDAFILSAAVSVLFTVFGTLFCRPVAEMLSGGGELAEQVYSYCLVTFMGSAAVIFLYLPLSYLQLEGKNRAISLTVAVMVAADIILDILFLYVLDLGLYGASAASVISSLAAAVCGFAALGKGAFGYRSGAAIPGIGNIGRILRYGSPAALGNMFDAVKLLLLNMIILTAAGEESAAVWAVLNTLSELSLMIVSGIPRAAVPMISAYHTAKENGGIRMLTALEVRAGLALSIAYAAAVTALHRPIELLFGIGGGMLFPIGCLGTSVILSTLCGIWEKHLGSIGRIAEANVAAGARACVMPVAAALLLSAAGAELWLFLPISALAAAAVTMAMTVISAAVSRGTDRPLSPVLLLDDSLERENKILDFSIAADMNEVCSAAEKIKDFCGGNCMDIKLTIKLGLAIEELLNVIIQKTPNIVSIDLRVFVLGGGTGVRLRCAGKSYDPFADRESDENFLMGVNMIRKMADSTGHNYIFGMNIITIIFPLENKANERKHNQRGDVF